MYTYIHYIFFMNLTIRIMIIIMKTDKLKNIRKEIGRMNVKLLGYVKLDNSYKTILKGEVEAKLARGRHHYTLEVNMK